MGCNGNDSDCQSTCWGAVDDSGGCGGCGACSDAYCDAMCAHNCYTGCDGCTDYCSGCWGSCYSCTGTCTGTCAVCTGGCQTYCDAGCASLAHTEAYNTLVTIKKQIASSDMILLRDLIEEEVLRRDLMPTHTDNEDVGDKALTSTMNIMLDNLGLMIDAADIPRPPDPGELMERAFIESVRDKARPLYNERISRA